MLKDEILIVNNLAPIYWSIYTTYVSDTLGKYWSCLTAGEVQKFEINKEWQIA